MDRWLVAESVDDHRVVIMAVTPEVEKESSHLKNWARWRSVAAQPAHQTLDVGSHGRRLDALLLREHEWRMREGVV